VRHPLRIGLARTCLWTLLAVACALVASGTAAAATTSAPSSSSRSVLQVGTTDDLSHPNVFAVSGDSDYEVATMEYDMLLRFGTDQLKAAPALATGCSHSDDYRTWTCHLRKGLRWSDGTPLTSADIAFSYRFVMKHHVSQFTSYFPSHPTFSTPNPRTFIWHARQPTFAPLVPPWVYIVPKHIWQRYDNQPLPKIESHNQLPAVGSGPYVLSSWSQGTSWTFTRNPYYWGPKPHYAKIEFHLYSNQDAMVLALKSGQIDIADELAPQSIPSLQGIKDITVQKVLPDTWLNLAFNFGGQGKSSHPNPALHDVRVRRAIQMAIDKAGIVRKVFGGYAEPGDTIIRPMSVYWHLHIPPSEAIPYDPAGAIKLLEQAGFTEVGAGGVRENPRTHERLILHVPVSEDTAGAVDTGQLLVGYLQRIGVKVDLQPVSDAQMGNYQVNGNFDAYMWYWSGDPDPNYQLSVFTTAQCGGSSDGCWSNKTYDRLYEQQRTTMDQAKRKVIVDRMERLAYEQVPEVVLAYPDNFEAYRNDQVTGWTPVPSPDGYLLPEYSSQGMATVHPPTSAAAIATTGLSGAAWLGVIGALAGLTVGWWAWSRRDRAEEP
jgi:peptide/nickel transport system substrate-binding protein